MTEGTPTVQRQYGAAIAIVSGLYSLLTATATSAMINSNSGLLMAGLGLIVLVHGIVLLIPSAGTLGDLSGPLMIVYSVLMLLNQALIGATDSMDWGMGGGMNGGMGSGMTAGMGWDLGMVALAVLMLISGLIMTAQRDDTAGM
jgi:hypothetical protein